MRRDLAIATALVVAVLAVYAQTLGFGFITIEVDSNRPAGVPERFALVAQTPCDFDDDKYVTRNAWVRAGLGVDGVRAAFSERSAPLNWSPLVVLSLMLDATLFGVDPVAFHAVNAVLHAVDAVLVFVLLRLLTGGVWPSAIVAALFALHPLRVESVAWVASRKDVLSAAFGLLALITYARYAVHGSLRAYSASFACTAAALLSKATWASLPFLFLLLDFWPLRRLGPIALQADPVGTPSGQRAGVARLIAEKLPFLALAAVVLFVTALYQSEHRISLEHLPLGARLSQALVASAWYVAKTLWPVSLSPHYPHPYLTASGGVPWTGTQIAVAGVLLASLTALAFRFAWRGYPLVGWLWFLGTLVPVLGFVQYGPQGMADRYTHLPHIGLFVAAVFGGWQMLAPRLRTPLARGLAVASVAAGLFGLGSAAFVQTRVWRDAESLFAHSLRVMPHNATMRRGIAYCYLGAGRFDEALRHSKAALNLQPGYQEARTVLATALARRAAEMPAAPAPDFLLDGGPSDGFVHEELAEIAIARGDREAGLDHLRRAQVLDPDSARARRQLEILLRERAFEASP